jgi:dGTP triphosphohydrolase
MEAATHDLNASLSALRAKEKRGLVAQLNAEADAIDEHIKTQEESEECKALAGQEKYEADQEKKAAQKIAESKRQAAASEAEMISGGEATAKHFRQQAANGRATAEKLRKL